MGCKHRTTKGNTTKYYFCNLFNKSVDNFKCEKCLMKLEEKNKSTYFDSKELEGLFKDIFGKGFGG